MEGTCNNRKINIFIETKDLLFFDVKKFKNTDSQVNSIRIKHDGPLLLNKVQTYTLV